MDYEKTVRAYMDHQGEKENSPLLQSIKPSDFYFAKNDELTENISNDNSYAVIVTPIDPYDEHGEICDVGLADIVLPEDIIMENLMESVYEIPRKDWDDFKERMENLGFVYCPQLEQDDENF